MLLPGKPAGVSVKLCSRPCGVYLLFPQTFCWGGWLLGGTPAKADSVPVSTAVQEEWGRHAANSVALHTVGEIDEQVYLRKREYLLCWE